MMNPYELPFPSPDLSPRTVVKIQLDALQVNDLMPNDEGIRLVFEYASAIHRKSTGSIQTFIHLLKRHADYRPITGFEQAHLAPMQIDNATARQHVTVRHRETEVSYLFVLSRADTDPHPDCWLTDAVLLHSSP